ncbi:hypothetical protein [Rhodococcus sp. NJ-530]|uniref:hypothetical protein n=1 Tax=Rhodococcus sp. NJ-530 TaxID=2490853 RepID=UPI0019D2B9CD|nr:hypothetical protein [Rhodococcus sp. NJ-530]
MPVTAVTPGGVRAKERGLSGENGRDLDDGRRGPGRDNGVVLVLVVVAVAVGDEVAVADAVVVDETGVVVLVAVVVEVAELVLVAVTTSG